MEKCDGVIHISEDVIVELARKTVAAIPGVILGGSGIAAKLGLGKKMGDGIKISVDDGKIPSIAVDTYISIKYGLRIPDVAWDVQEKLKEKLESFTGYTVKAVNVNVQSIHFAEKSERNEKNDSTGKPEKSEKTAENENAQLAEAE